MDEANVSIVDILVIVILGLHHFIAQAKKCPKQAPLGLVICRRVEFLLQAVIQSNHAGRPAINGRHNLDIMDGIEAKFLWNPFRDNPDDPVGCGSGIFGGEEEEVAFIPALREIRELALVDPVGICDDHRVRSLAVDRFQARDRDDPAVDQISKHISCAHRGELVHIPDKQKARSRLNCFQQVICQ